MKLSVTVAASLLLSLCSVAEDWVHPSAAETKDRISADELAALVQEPAALLENGEIDAAKARLEALLRASREKGGSDTLQTADLHMGFGLAAFGLAEKSKDQAMIDVAIASFDKAAASYESVYGPLHPEASLAKTTLADALDTLVGVDSIPRQIGLVRSVLAAREAQLGVRNIETLASMGDLGKLLVAQPNAPAGQLEEAVSMMDLAIERAGATRGEHGDATPAFFGLVAARAETKLGRPEQAERYADIALAAIDPEGDHCMRTSRQAEWLAADFDQARQTSSAARFKRRYEQLCGSPEELEALLKELSG